MESKDYFPAREMDSEVSIRALDSLMKAIEPMYRRGKDKVLNLDSSDAMSRYSIEQSMTPYYFKIAALVLYLAATITAFTFYGTRDDGRDFNFEIFFTSTGMDGPKHYVAFDFAPILALGAGSIIATISLALQLMTWSSFVEGAKSRNNFYRWVGESLSFPVFFTCVMLIMADFDLYSLISCFAISHIYTVFLAIQELNSSPKDGNKGGANYSAVLYSLWVLILLFIPLIVFMSYYTKVSDMQMTSWAAFGFLVARLVLMFILQAAYTNFLRGGSGLCLFNEMANCHANYNIYVNASLSLSTICDLGILILILVMATGNNKWIDGADTDTPKKFLMFKTNLNTTFDADFKAISF